MEDQGIFLDEIVDPNIIEWVIRRIDFRGDDECWSWFGGFASDTRGRIYYQGKSRYAYQIVYRICNGPIESGKVIMHTCDNPNCVNPNHLVCGTQKGNMQDRDAKGRDQHTKAKSTLVPVKMIRRI